MNNTAKIIDLDAERFISIIKRDDFDYTVWQREYFDNMKPGQIMKEASAYARSHSHKGKGEYI